MRMWLCDPKIMCQKHLCGEHLEVHMFLGSLKQGKKIDGYLNNNLFEPMALWWRHKQLADEMIERGYNHKSEMFGVPDNVLSLPEEKRDVRINRDAALRDLLDRCPECRNRSTSSVYQPLAST